MIVGLLFAIAAAAAPVPATVAKSEALDAAKLALDEFRLQEALVILERARGEGPYVWAEHVRLEELLGTAYAYLARNDDALAAFERLLALNPRHAVSYTLSPKVTFIFERAKELARAKPAPALEVSWPADSRVDEAVPLEIEVAADPNRFFATATLYHRVRGEHDFSAIELRLPAAGARERVLLPPRLAAADLVVEIFLIAKNARGDEVYTWYSRERPRDLTLRYRPPDPWYGQWWVWVVVGGAVAAASVGIATVAMHEPNRFIDGGFHSP